MAAMSAHLAMRSGNPALTDEAFRVPRVRTLDDAMSIGGTVNKTALALLILLTAATWTWSLGPADPRVGMLTLVGLIGGLIAAIATMARKEWAPYTTPAYAALEGLALGAISIGFETRYPGLVSQAVFLTFGTLAAMLLAYRAGLVRAT